MSVRQQWSSPEPGRATGGGSKEPLLADAGLGVSTALVLSVVVASESTGADTVAGYLFAVGFGALLLLRRRIPIIILVATVLAIFVYYILDLPPIGMVLPAAGALFSAAEQRRTGWAIGVASGLIAVATFFRLAGEDVDDTLQGYGFVSELALAAAAIALGAAVRLAREARERAVRIAELTAAEQQHAAQSRAQAERMQIARDLHDTIGHTLSVASLHAGVAHEAADRDRQAMRQAVDLTREATAGALRELRRTVKILRDDDAPASPGLADLSEVIASTRKTGLRVELESSVDPGELSRSVDGVAYRVVQESLTNVLRHADAEQVRITARVTDGALELRILDDGPKDRSRPVPGAGIRGMRERVELLGGTLTAEPTADGFFVEAVLPTGYAHGAPDRKQT